MQPDDIRMVEELEQPDFLGEAAALRATVARARVGVCRMQRAHAEDARPIDRRTSPSTGRESSLASAWRVG